MTEPLTLETAEERELWRLAAVDMDPQQADIVVRAYRERCAPTGDAPDEHDDWPSLGQQRLADAIRAALFEYRDEYGGQLAAAWEKMGRTGRTMAADQLARLVYASTESERCAPGASEPRTPTELRERLSHLVDRAPDDRLREEVEHALGQRVRLSELGVRVARDPEETLGERALEALREASPPAAEPLHEVTAEEFHENRRAAIDAHRKRYGHAPAEPSGAPTGPGWWWWRAGQLWTHPAERLEEGRAPGTTHTGHLRAIADHGYSSARFSSAQELVHTMDWMVDTARAALAGKPVPELTDGPLCATGASEPPREVLDAVRAAYYDGGEPIASLEQEHGRTAVAEALGFERDEPTQELAAEYHAQGDPPREVLDAVRANYPRAEPGGAPTGPGWWWLDEKPVEVTDEWGGLTYEREPGIHTTMDGVDIDRWGGPCLQGSADASGNALEALRFIAEQFCSRRPDDGSEWVRCGEIGECVTEYCLPCYARAALEGCLQGSAETNEICERYRARAEIAEVQTEQTQALLDALTRAVEAVLKRIDGDDELALFEVDDELSSALRAALDDAKGDA